jgi:hypothetical protein
MKSSFFFCLFGDQRVDRVLVGIAVSSERWATWATLGPCVRANLSCFHSCSESRPSGRLLKHHKVGELQNRRERSSNLLSDQRSLITRSISLIVSVCCIAKVSCANSSVFFYNRLCVAIVVPGRFKILRRLSHI